MWFQGAFDNTTDRGFSIALTDQPEIRFVLRHRAINEQDVPRLVSPVIVSVLAETGISHCPWCGERLLTFYKPLVIEQIKRARP